MIALYQKYPTDYIECLSVQRRLNELRNEGRISDSIIATEHDDTYTGGIHFNGGDTSGYPVPIIKVERGGNLTYHGRGQLVLYFIFNLKERSMNVKELIQVLQGSVIKSLADFGLDADGRLFEKTGVWVGERKICSIGLAVKGTSTLHGFAINLNTDLSKFYKINPCDLDPGVMTSLKKELGREVEMNAYRDILLSHLSEDFNEPTEGREWKFI